ncbi:MAG: Ni/Fe-hydrogenase cytochrome b subunit [Caldilineae bacterium]|nr:MAG: Ni/Fe-hydrogenase cytochrome b subunit [Caldilineae bacterium]
MTTYVQTRPSREMRPFPVRAVAILLVLMAIGLVTAIVRYANGIGAISNLSDGRAWGLWISFDLYCGVALAAGGFTLAATVYIFRRKKYYPIVRGAILTAFLGYLMVIAALLVDLGQPWRIWHMIIYWNPHSPLFEVGWCVLLYTLVLALEFSPNVFERFNMQVPLRWIRAIQIPLVIAGIVLSTLHQSSLGSVLLMMPDKIHPLWFTPILPGLFFLSAIAVGPAMVIFESYLSSKAFGHRLDPEIPAGLGRALVWLLALYLLVKLADLLVAGEFGLIFSSALFSVLFLVEVLGGVVAPLILFALPAVRASERGLFWSAVLVVLGLILNRFNVSLLALEGRPGVSYFPHPLEFAISIAIVAAGVLAYVLATRYLPVLQHEAEQPA